MKNPTRWLKKVPYPRDPIRMIRLFFFFFKEKKKRKHGGKNATALKIDARVLWFLLPEALRIECSKQLCDQPRSAD